MEFTLPLFLEIVAVITGFACVYLQTRENVLAWPLGIISVVLYVYIFWDVRLYSDMILNSIYIILNVYGWWTWQEKKEESDNLKIERLKWPGQLMALVTIIVGTYFWGTLMQQTTDASFPYGDAFTTITSLVAQFLLTRKVIDNWFLWIIADVVAIYIYCTKGIYLTAGLFVGYLLLCILGWVQWQNKSVQS